MKTFFKVALGLAIVGTVIYAGGDMMEPEVIEEVVEAVEVMEDVMEEEDSGAALNTLSMLALMAMTAVTGLFFVNKETKV